VVGPSHRAGIGVVVIGSTAQQLVREAPRAVAVVPRGWRPNSTSPLLRIGCGYDGSTQSEAALATAAGLTRLVGGELEIVRAAWSTTLGGPLGIAVLADLEAGAETGVRDAADALPPDVHAHGTAVLAHPAHLLVSRSHELDVLVVGSRGKGPLNAAVTGSVSTRVIRDAACPVIVVPDSAPAIVGAYASDSTRSSSATY
jgi:nucleotide-binding universal stress UspA family protein